MADRRNQLVERVVHALEETEDPDQLVRSYFDADRSAVIEGTRQTLEATREDVSGEKVAAVVDRELIEALRFPATPRRGLAVSLYLNRGKVALGSALVTIGSLLTLLLI